MENIDPMGSSNKLRTIILISDMTFYPIFFHQKLSDLYHIYSLSAKEFKVEEIENIPANLIIIDDAEIKDHIVNLCLELRQRKEFHTVPIIIISGDLKKSYINRLVGAGANDFFREPLEEEEIIPKLRNVEHYQEIERKMDSLAGTATKLNSESSDLRKHLMIDRHLFDPICQSVKEGGYVTLLLCAVDQEFALDDHLVEETTRLIKQSIRTKDLVISLGKGKYLVAFNNTPLKSGFPLAETIRDSVSSNQFEKDGTKIQLTISIGVASQKKPPYKDFSAMIADAKKALTKAKEVSDTIVNG